MQNAYLVAKIGVDTAENEPRKECCVVACRVQAARWGRVFTDAWRQAEPQTKALQGSEEREIQRIAITCAFGLKKLQAWVREWYFVQEKLRRNITEP